MEPHTVPIDPAHSVRAGSWRVIAISAFTVLAMFLPERSAATDLEYGAYLASECVTCHRADGEMDGIPSIVGWDESHFVDAMKAYLGAGRDNPTMRTIVKRLTDEDMAALAAYFGSLAD